MRKIGLAGVVASLAVAAAVFAGGASAQTSCSGLFSGSSDNVVVFPGNTCVLQEATVSGNVIVMPGGSIEILGSEIDGNVIALTPGYFVIDAFGLDPSFVGGNLIVIGATGVPPLQSGYLSNIVCNTEIGLNLKLISNQAAFAVGDPATGCFGLFGPPVNTIGQNAIILANTGTPFSVAVSFNDVTGLLLCFADTPPATGIPASNTAAAKLGECSGL